MSVTARVLLALVLLPVVLLGLVPAYITVNKMFLQPRTVLSGILAGKGTEYVSHVKGGSDRLLVTIEGQPYVFYRTIGWFGSKDGALEAVQTGVPAAVRVLTRDLEAEAAQKESGKRRVEILALEQGDRTVFAEYAIHVPWIIGSVFMLGMGAGLGLSLLRLVVARPEALDR